MRNADCPRNGVKPLTKRMTVTHRADSVGKRCRNSVKVTVATFTCLLHVILRIIYIYF